jgi:hypothetical protein
MSGEDLRAILLVLWRNTHILAIAGTLIAFFVIIGLSLLRASGADPYPPCAGCAAKDAALRRLYAALQKKADDHA